RRKPPAQRMLVQRRDELGPRFALAARHGRAQLRGVHRTEHHGRPDLAVDRKHSGIGRREVAGGTAAAGSLGGADAAGSAASGSAMRSASTSVPSCQALSIAGKSSKNEPSTAIVASSATSTRTVLAK